MQFAAIPGLEDVKANLLMAVRNGKVAHAQLFFGKDGSANLALAMAYATYLNCEDRQAEDSCGKCAACSKNSRLVHPDLHFIFPVATSKTVDKKPTSADYMKEWRTFAIENPFGSIHEWGETMGVENKQPAISADEARNIVTKISLKAFEGEFKILILWLPEMMNQTSGNAMLKILEEPPAKTVFLLVANNHEKLLTTILSRTQKVMIRGFDENEIVNYLTAQYQCVDDRASKIAFIADGNMNEAIRLVNEDEEDHHEMFREWMRKCFTFKVKDLTELGERFQKMGREGQKTLLHYGLSTMRECLVFQVAKQLSKLRPSEQDFVDKFSKATNSKVLENIGEQLNNSYFHIERNANPKILFLDMSLQIAMILKSKK